MFNKLKSPFQRKESSDDPTPKDPIDTSSLDEIVKTSFASRIETLNKACKKYENESNEVSFALDLMLAAPGGEGEGVLDGASQRAGAVPHGQARQHQLGQLPGQALHQGQLHQEDPGAASLPSRQVWLRGLESRAYTPESKKAVLAALEEAGHSYTAFFVCRNPIARLLSVYNYLVDGRNNAKSYVSGRMSPPQVWGKPARADFQAKRPPSWSGFLKLVANSKEVRKAPHSMNQTGKLPWSLGALV